MILTFRFQIINNVQVGKLITKSKTSSCNLDPINRDTTVYDSWKSAVVTTLL